MALFELKNKQTINKQWKIIKQQKEQQTTILIYSSFSSPPPPSGGNTKASSKLANYFATLKRASNHSSRRPNPNSTAFASLVMTSCFQRSPIPTRFQGRHVPGVPKRIGILSNRAFSWCLMILSSLSFLEVINIMNVGIQILYGSPGNS